MNDSTLLTPNNSPTPSRNIRFPVLAQTPKSHLWRLTILIIVILFTLSLTPSTRPVKAVLPSGYPEKFAIYYGDPAGVNGSGGNTTLASEVFNDYDMILLGEGIEQATHAYHTNTQTIIQNIQSTTRTYGYLDLCVQNPVSSLYRCSNFPEAELESRTDKWKEIGAAGIFLDQAGCDYVVSRDRLNTVVDYIHSQGMSVMINVWNQDDAFIPGSMPSPYDGYADCNPNNLETHLGPNDYTLLESWAVILSDWSENWSYDANMLYPRGDKTLRHKNQYGVKVATVNTIGYNNPPFNQAQFDYVWWTTFLYGFDAMGWGETWVYSADCQCLPFHPRPAPANTGESIVPLSVSNAGDIHTRDTTTGFISVDGSAHVGQFVTDGTPPPSLTPSNTPTPTLPPVVSSISQSGSAPTDIVAGNVTFDGNNVRFTMQTNGAPWEYFSLFVDTDDNSATGYRPSNSTTGQSFSGIGAEKLIQNGYIYDWAGNNSNQLDWNWSYSGSVSVEGSGTSQLLVTTPYTQLGYLSGTDINILGQHMSTGYATYDFLYRDPAQIWQASSRGIRIPTATPTPTIANTPVVSSISQSGSAATDIVAGSAAFDGSNIILMLQTNGAPWQYFRVFIDTDNNPATGFIRTNGLTGQPYAMVGADKLLENGYIYNFSGADQNSWGWAFTGNSAIGEGSGTSSLTLRMTYTALDYTSNAVMRLLVEHVSTSYVTHDFLYRDPTQVWQVSSQSLPTSTPTFTPSSTPTNTPTATYTPSSTPTVVPTSTPGVPDLIQQIASCVKQKAIARILTIQVRTGQFRLFIQEVLLLRGWLIPTSCADQMIATARYLQQQIIPAPTSIPTFAPPSHH